MHVFAFGASRLGWLLKGIASWSALGYVPTP